MKIKMAPSLVRGADGIWTASGDSTISYPEHGNDFCFQVEADSFWFNHRNRCLIEVMKRHPPDGVFVEIGGGNGFVSAAIEAAGWPVVLVEPGPHGARNARARGLENVVCATFHDAGFVDNSIGAAGAFDVLEHIEDDEAFLRDVHRALVPGGRLYVTVPAFRVLWSQEDDIAGHYRRHTLSSLRALLQSAGFEVEYLTYFFSFLQFPVFLLRTLPYRFGIRRTREQAMASARSEHQASGLAKSILDRLMRRELDRIRSGRKMLAGTSCLAAARRPSAEAFSGVR